MRIAIDLTLLHSGKENDYLEALVIRLIKSFGNLGSSQNIPGRTRYQFILITAPWNHAELIQYETTNTTCLLMEHLRPNGVTSVSDIEGSTYLCLVKKIARKTLNQIAHLLGENRMIQLAKKVVGKLKTKLKPAKTLLEQHKVDLLFCPFSAPTYAENVIPTIAIVYNVQQLSYSFLFNFQEINFRKSELKKLIYQAQRIVCLSEFSRQSLISYFQASPDQLLTIPIDIQDSLPRLADTSMLEYLDQVKLKNKRYAFYPANYRPHNNHHLLLLAYSIYCSRLSEKPMDLVLTGVLPKAEQKLRNIVDRMNLQGQVHVLSNLSDRDLAAVWQGSFCFVFPPLCEKLGMHIPLLKAMEYGKVVTCSYVGSLPEIGGDAVLYFDPRKPEEIAECLKRLEQDSVLVKQLIWKGYQRLSYYRQQDMLNLYLTCFEETISRT